MDYREYPPPHVLRALLKAAWTLETGGAASDWFRHFATPDGCIELIWRLGGRSSWGEEQPPCFVAGLNTAPVELRLGGGARFLGLRFRPWAWNRFGDMPSPRLLDRWAPLDLGAAPQSPEEAFALVAPTLLDAGTAALGDAILASSSAHKLAERSGRPVRWLQRWFEREIGLPPRTYLRLLRFQESFASLAGADGGLADHAAAHGFADQAHMAREYRSMAGVPASRARTGSQPPFI
jgi:AraC-like DNA-binding protein